MEESVDLLITTMHTDVDSCALGGDLDLEGKYGATIQNLGAADFFAGVFHRFEDSTLTNWLLCLTFAWKELSFDQWKQVLYSFSDHIDALYGFIPFASQFLGIDIVRVIAEDPSVNQRVRRYAAHRFPKGGPAPGSVWVREMLHARGIDVHQIWHRLEAEGAPMKVELSK
jgi:hypothetical protein